MSAIKKLLRKHGYIFTMLKDADGSLILRIPERKQEPTIEAIDFKYKIGKDKVTVSIGEDSSELECPQYACRALILFHVNRTCEQLGYGTEYLDFRLGSDSISEEAFFHAMWPEDVELNDELREKEYNLQQILISAKHALLPFDDRYEFEARQAGVEQGYQVVRDYFFGEA